MLFLPFFYLCNISLTILEYTSIMSKDYIHIEAQQSWLKYMTVVGDSQILLSDLHRMGFTYEEINDMFKQAIAKDKKIDIETLKS